MYGPTNTWYEFIHRWPLLTTLVRMPSWATRSLRSCALCCCLNLPRSKNHCGGRAGAEERLCACTEPRGVLMGSAIGELAGLADAGTSNAVWAGVAGRLAAFVVGCGVGLAGSEGVFD